MKYEDRDRRADEDSWDEEEDYDIRSDKFFLGFWGVLALIGIVVLMMFP